MDENEKTLKLLVELGVINGDQIEELKGKLDSLDKGSEQTAASTATMTEKVADLTEEAGNAGSAVQGLHISHKALHQITHLLGHHTIPQLGKGLNSLRFGPLAGSLIVGGLAFGYFHEKIKQTNEELDKAAEAAAKPDFLNAIKAQQEVLEKAASSAEAYADKIDKILLGEQGVSNELARQLSLMRAIEAAKAEANRATEEAASAKIKADEAAGKISPEVAAERQAGLKLNQPNEIKERRRKEEAEAVANAKAIQEAEDQQEQLRINAETLRKTHEVEAARRKKTETLFGEGSEAEKKREEAKEKLKKAEEAYGKVGWNQIESDRERLRGTNLGSRERDNLERSVNYREEELKGTKEYRNLQISQGESDNLRTGSLQFKKDQDSTGDFEKLGRQAADAEEAYSKNSTAIASLTEELRKTTDALLATKGLSQEAIAAQHQTELQGFRETISQGNKKFTDDNIKEGASGDIDKMKVALAASQAHGRELVKAALEAHKEGHQELVGVINLSLKDLRIANASLSQRIDKK